MRVGDRFDILFGTYLSRLSTFFLYQSPIFFYSTPYGVFFALVGPFGAVLGLGSGSKNCWDLLIYTISYGFGCKALSFCFLSGFFGLFLSLESFKIDSGMVFLQLVEHVLNVLIFTQIWDINP